MSIFKETFQEFVFNQLKIREASIDPNSDRLGISKATLKNNSIVPLPAGAFYTNTTSKQCIIRMSSGADLKEDNDLLDLEDYSRQSLLDEGLAIRYMLEGGIPTKDVDFSGYSPGQEITVTDGNGNIISQENVKLIESAPRGRANKQFAKGGKSDVAQYGATYGDPWIRSNASVGQANDGFGIVPMPGIIDAEIRTKTAYGSLRDAKINFVCHNRRQLDVLETLYMRPGMPILLEWGWNPYLSLSGNSIMKQEYFPYLWEWFNKEQNINNLNKIIHNRVKASGGNYDGFIGYVKNFEITSRPDGGYDCTTELAAMGEVLEGLKGKSNGFTLKEENGEKNVEVDNLEFILIMLREWAEIIDVIEYIENYQNNVKYSFLNIENNFLFTPNLAKFIQLVNDKIVPELGKKQFSEDIDFLKEQENLIDGNKLNDKTKRGVVYLKKILDPYILYKGESLGLTGQDKNMSRSAEYYIKWELLAIFLNKLVFETYQEGTETSPLTEITWIDEVEPSNGDKKNPLRYSKYSFANDSNVEIRLDSYIDSYGRFTSLGYSEFEKVDISNLMDMSVDPSICLLPHQLDNFNFKTPPVKSAYKQDAVNARNKQRIIEIDNKRNISDIFINLDHLLKRYKETRYKGDEINENFNLFTFLQTIWEKDINNACVDLHNFTIHTEKTKSNLIRIIDMQQDNILPDDLYEFQTHGNKSIVRDFNYNTTIDSKLSATVSIASQSPNSISDLDAVSFAAFNKNIKYRFFKEEIEETAQNRDKKSKKYDKDLEKLEAMLSFLYNYKKEMLRGAYGSKLDSTARNEEKLPVSTAKKYIKSIESLIISLKSRYSETEESENIYKGYRKKSHHPFNIGKSTVIPLKFNAQIDGIGGLVIGNVFKVSPKFLPRGYQGKDIAFAIMTENQTITAGQDWTTDFSGQLILLDLPKGGEWDDLKIIQQANTPGIKKDISYYNYTDENIYSSQAVADSSLPFTDIEDEVFLKVNSNINIRIEPYLNYETPFNDNIIRIITNEPIGRILGIVLNKIQAPPIESAIRLISGTGEQIITSDDKSTLQWRTETDYEDKKFEVVYKDSSYPVYIVNTHNTPKIKDTTLKEGPPYYQQRFVNVKDFEKGDYYWIPEGVPWAYKKPIRWMWYLIKFEDDINFQEQSDNNDDWDDVKDPNKNTQYTLKNGETIQGGVNGVKIGWVREDILMSYEFAV